MTIFDIYCIYKAEKKPQDKLEAKSYYFKSLITDWATIAPSLTAVAI
jgi:hypothetical protein